MPMRHLVGLRPALDGLTGLRARRKSMRSLAVLAVLKDRRVGSGFRRVPMRHTAGLRATRTGVEAQKFAKREPMRPRVARRRKHGKRQMSSTYRARGQRKMRREVGEIGMKRGRIGNAPPQASREREIARRAYLLNLRFIARKVLDEVRSAARRMVRGLAQGRVRPDVKSS